MCRRRRSTCPTEHAHSGRSLLLGDLWGHLAGPNEPLVTAAGRRLLVHVPASPVSDGGTFQAEGASGEGCRAATVEAGRRPVWLSRLAQVAEMRGRGFTPCEMSVFRAPARRCSSSPPPPRTAHRPRRLEPGGCDHLVGSRGERAERRFWPAQVRGDRYRVCLRHWMRRGARLSWGLPSAVSLLSHSAAAAPSRVRESAPSRLRPEVRAAACSSCGTAPRRGCPLPRRRGRAALWIAPGAPRSPRLRTGCPSRSRPPTCGGGRLEDRPRGSAGPAPTAARAGSLAR